MALRFGRRTKNPFLAHRLFSTDRGLDGIRRNLSEYRSRTSNDQQISFQELFKRNVEDSKSSTKPALDAIRENLRHMKTTDRMSLPALKGALNLKPSSGVSGALPEKVFGREMRENAYGDRSSSSALKTNYVRMYGYTELGAKLSMLRPQEKGGFSLEELNQRLTRLREIEEEESLSTVQGVSYRDLRECLVRLDESDEAKAKKITPMRLDMLSRLGGTPTHHLGPPQEHLVQKYFHPDNMSSAEKLKIELAKVRDEFKMSESDCGSAPVQVAQLTTKIKHLSAVLHKKDVHSRKGLLAMVQRRKRLLKYLRRTGWDSYCFVISKLGLRDNPDHIYKTRSGQAASS